MQVSTGWEGRKSQLVFALDCAECDGFLPKRLFGTPLCPLFVQFPSPLASTCSHFGHELNLKVRKRV